MCSQGNEGEPDELPRLLNLKTTGSIFQVRAALGHGICLAPASVLGHAGWPALCPIARELHRAQFQGSFPKSGAAWPRLGAIALRAFASSRLHLDCRWA